MKNIHDFFDKNIGNKRHENVKNLFRNDVNNNKKYKNNDQYILLLIYLTIKNKEIKNITNSIIFYIYYFKFEYFHVYYLKKNLCNISFI